MDAHTADLIIETVEDRSGVMKDSRGTMITHYVISAENWRLIRTSITNSVVAAQTKPMKETKVVCPCGDEDHTLDDMHALGMVCGRCNKHTGNNNQGHYWAMCKVLLQQGRGVDGSMREHHFCCPDDCELEEATRD